MLLGSDYEKRIEVSVLIITLRIFLERPMYTFARNERQFFSTFLATSIWTNGIFSFFAQLTLPITLKSGHWPLLIDTLMEALLDVGVIVIAF